VIKGKLPKPKKIPPAPANVAAPVVARRN